MLLLLLMEAACSEPPRRMLLLRLSRHGGCCCCGYRQSCCDCDFGKRSYSRYCCWGGWNYSCYWRRLKRQSAAAAASREGGLWLLLLLRLLVVRLRLQHWERDQLPTLQPRLLKAGLMSGPSCLTVAKVAARRLASDTQDADESTGNCAGCRDDPKLDMLAEGPYPPPAGSSLQASRSGAARLRRRCPAARLLPLADPASPATDSLQTRLLLMVTAWSEPPRKMLLLQLLAKLLQLRLLEAQQQLLLLLEGGGATPAACGG